MQCRPSTLRVTTEVEKDGAGTISRIRIREDGTGLSTVGIGEDSAGPAHTYYNLADARHIIVHAYYITHRVKTQKQQQ